MMTRYLPKVSVLSVVLCAALLLSPRPDAAFSQSGDGIAGETAGLIARVRGETASFRDINVATAAGYNPFLDCLSDNTLGGMGQHYVNAQLVDDGTVDPLTPEALVYEPGPDGELILVALEYIMPIRLWTEANPPVLFGQQFHLNDDIPEAPDAWVLHLWVWAHNPDGIFADYNPTVFCSSDKADQAETTDDRPRLRGVSGPVEQGDTGFGALAYPYLWREAGVSGPVEQGDTGFGALAYPPDLRREARTTP